MPGIAPIAFEAGAIRHDRAVAWAAGHSYVMAPDTTRD